MSNIAAAAIVQRIREVIESGAGTLRTITVGRFLGNWPEGLSEEEQKRRALEAPRTRVKVNLSGRSPNSPPINGNLIIYDAAIDITVSRLIPRATQISSTDYDTLESLALEDADVVRQAMEYPGNLTQTAAAVATDIVSGMLSWTGAPPTVAVGLMNDGAQRLESTHSFTACVVARPAVT